MDLQLTGKNVLVTGAGQGLGLAIAAAFADEGANVAFAYNASSEGVQKGAAAAKEAGRAALAIRCDVTNGDDLERGVGEVVSQLGSIDVLVNYAAYTDTGPFLDIDADDLQRMVDVTVVGTMRMTQAVVRHMVEVGIEGSIMSLMGDSGRDWGRLHSWRALNYAPTHLGSTSMPNCRPSLMSDLGMGDGLSCLRRAWAVASGSPKSASASSSICGSCRMRYAMPSNPAACSCTLSSCAGW